MPKPTFPMRRSVPATAPRVRGRSTPTHASIRLTPRHGGGVRDVRVRYALYGAAGAPVVVVQGGISANRYAASARRRMPAGGSAIVGADRAIDTRRFRVLSIEWLDRTISARASCDELHAIGSEDQADAIAALLAELGIRRVHAFVGASYGAMVGLAFAARHPDARARARRDRRRASRASARDRGAQPAARDRASRRAPRRCPQPGSISRAASR